MDTGGNSLKSQSCPDGTKRRVCYYYDRGIANVDYGDDHHMVPRRVDMAHALLRVYGLLGDMDRLRTSPATDAEIEAFHSPVYVGVLRDLTPEGFNAGGKMMQRAQDHEIGKLRKGGVYDNPPIAGLWNYCQRYAGGSLAAARALCSRRADIAINWSGGMHHACEKSASGFCFVNDIVLAIKELLNHFRRVLYVDIDVHHGDGVETAFVKDNRVMTVSFHQRAGRRFFPEGRGHVEHVGEGPGLYRAVNVPLRMGMDDEGYCRLFKEVMGKVMDVFDPEAIVMQCGGDSLSGDRLGGLNLSIAGHAKCVSYIRSFNLPLLLLGGGGYTVNHVAACWCYETAVAVGKDIADDIPSHWYDTYYRGQHHKLHYPVDKKCENKNNYSYIDRTKATVMQNLANLERAPSVQFKDPAGGVIDAAALFYDGDPPEEHDPLERKYRLCLEREKRRLLGELEDPCFFAWLGKRQLDLPDKDRENGGHQARPCEPVKKHRRDNKVYMKY